LSSISTTDLRVYPSLAIVGGGLAGIAAAESASRNGFRVTLFERSRILGGRAASLFDPNTNQWIDNGQHIALGCCTELLDLNQQLGLTRFFEQKKTIPFAQIGGKHGMITPTTWLPNRWQFFPAFLTFPFLSLKERFITGLLLRELGTQKKESESESRTFAEWLRTKKVSVNTIKKFWEPFIFSTLSEGIEHVSFDAVQQIIRDSFLAGHQAMTFHIPTVPLQTIYHENTAKQLQNRGIELHFFKRVKRFLWEFQTDTETDNNGSDTQSNTQSNTQSDTQQQYTSPKIQALELADGSVWSFDYYLLAVPLSQFWKIMTNSGLEAYTEQLALERFEPGTVTTIHLWFNRRILPDEFSHCVLLGEPGQFLFCPKRNEKSERDNYEKNNNGIYHNVVISASHRLLSEHEFTSRGSFGLVERVVQQLQKTFVRSFQNKTTQLMFHRVTTHFEAVFSPNPAIYLERPESETPFDNLVLAGDWTQTKLPAALEGAVRSGRHAVQILKKLADIDGID
jgi:zeta-carotene desaturase